MRTKVVFFRLSDAAGVVCMGRAGGRGAAGHSGKAGQRGPVQHGRGVLWVEGGGVWGRPGAFVRVLGLGAGGGGAGACEARQEV